MNQPTFNFDLTSLQRCIRKIRPKKFQTLFAGLLRTAAEEPRTVTDIDADGWLMMTASVDTVAFWGGVHVRTIQRATDAAKKIGMIDHSAGINTRSEWVFCLAAVLPVESIDWFRDRVERGDFALPEKQNATPAFCGQTPPQTNAGVAFFGQTPPRAVANAGVAFSNHTSSSFCLATAELAKLAGCCEKFGIAVSGSDWDKLTVGNNAVDIPEVIDAVFHLAAASGVIANDAVNRHRVFVSAVVSQGKHYPWSYFRGLLTNHTHLSTRTKPQDEAAAAKLLQIADQNAAAKLLSPDELAWLKVRAALRKFNHWQERELLAHLGPELYAAASTAGLSDICGANLQTAPRLRAALAAAIADRSLAPSGPSISSSVT